MDGRWTAEGKDVVQCLRCSIGLSFVPASDKSTTNGFFFRRKASDHWAVVTPCTQITHYFCPLTAIKPAHCSLWLKYRIRAKTGEQSCSQRFATCIRHNCFPLKASHTSRVDPVLHLHPQCTNQTASIAAKSQNYGNSKACA